MKHIIAKLRLQQSNGAKNIRENLNQICRDLLPVLIAECLEHKSKCFRRFARKLCHVSADIEHPNKVLGDSAAILLQIQVDAANDILCDRSPNTDHGCANLTNTVRQRHNKVVCRRLQICISENIRQRATD